MLMLNGISFESEGDSLTKKVGTFIVFKAFFLFDYQNRKAVKSAFECNGNLTGQKKQQHFYSLLQSSIWIL